MCESTSLFIGEKNPLKSYLIKNMLRAGGVECIVLSLMDKFIKIFYTKTEKSSCYFQWHSV